MNRRDFDIDHIDPRWEEGRDYQLVCGLDCLLNFRESDPGFNVSKSNRFLAWRWSRDEIGVVPEELGDLAYFLVGADIEKDIPGEWVLMEFLSEEWFEVSKRTRGTTALNHLRDNSQIVRKQWDTIRSDPEAYEKNRRRLKSQSARWREQNPDLCKEAHEKSRSSLKALWAENTNKAQEIKNAMAEGRERWLQTEDYQRYSLQHSARMREFNKQRWQCVISGRISTAAGLSHIQKSLGIDHKDPNNRIRIN